jgi:hypothetical protein
VGQGDAVTAVRRYAGVLLNTPQFMLDGIVSAPQDPAADPVVTVPGTSTGELCAYFQQLTSQASSWSGHTVSCSDGGITVQ